MKHSTRSIRRYRDSQAKLILAKRRYQDALRRYRDAEDDAKRSKLAVFIEKVEAKLAKFKQDHPSIAKVLRIFLKIDSSLRAMGAGLGTGSAIGMTILSLTKAGKQEIGGLKGVLPGAIYMLVNSALSACASYVEWRVAKGLE
jgi:hypothetical protein